MATKTDRQHREMFFAWNGTGPYACFFCGDDVSFEDVLVHHEDHVHSNNVPSNLKPAHRSCHIQHHRKLMPDSEKESISVRRTGRRMSDETKKKLSDYRKSLGPTGPQSEETRRRKSEAVKQHWDNDPDRKNNLVRGEDGKFVRREFFDTWAEQSG